MKRRNQKQWRAVIARQQQSGLTAVQFCRKENISPTYFSTKKIQLFKDIKKPAPVFTKVNITTRTVPEPALEYSYKNSKLKFNSLPNSTWLSQLLRTLS